MQGLTISQPGARLVFKSAEEEINNAGFTTQRAKLTQAELITMVPLIGGQSQYNIPMLVNTNGSTGIQLANENRLALQDAFVTGMLGFFLCLRASTSDFAFQLFTYPSLAVFTAAQAAALQVLYNSWLSLTVDQTQLISFYSMQKHLQINNMQAAADPADAGARDETTGNADGYYPTEPNWVFIGSTNIQYQITLPAALPSTGTGAPPANAYMCFIHRGVRAQNVTRIVNG